VEQESEVSDFKYVNFRVTLGSVEYDVPVMFPDKLVHLDVATVIMVAMRRTWPRGVIKPVSAGTVALLQVEATTGRSESLDLDADPADAQMINTYSYCHGVRP
jgi:hypothetical protein